MLTRLGSWEGPLHSGQACADTTVPALLLEAHIFQEVKLDQNVQVLCLSRSTQDGELANDVWATAGQCDVVVPAQ